jgi:hypothetical protein
MKHSFTISSDDVISPIDLEANTTVQLGTTLQNKLIKHILLYIGCQLISYLFIVCVCT